MTPSISNTVRWQASLDRDDDDDGDGGADNNNDDGEGPSDRNQGSGDHQIEGLDSDGGSS